MLCERGEGASPLQPGGSERLQQGAQHACVQCDSAGVRRGCGPGHGQAAVVPRRCPGTLYMGTTFPSANDGPGLSGSECHALRFSECLSPRKVKSD